MTFFSRWSDFHVREISKDGEIARLTDLVSVPEKPKAKPLAVPVDENYKLSDEDEIQIIRVKSNEGKIIFKIPRNLETSTWKEYRIVSDWMSHPTYVISRSPQMIRAHLI